MHADRHVATTQRFRRKHRSALQAMRPGLFPGARGDDRVRHAELASPAANARIAETFYVANLAEHSRQIHERLRANVRNRRSRFTSAARSSTASAEERPLNANDAICEADTRCAQLHAA
jgi:hypothetical protein